MAETLEQHIAFVRQASADESQNIIDERIRFVEFLWFHAKSGWFDDSIVTRGMNFICNPETWEDWKRRGGDSEIQRSKGG